MGKSNLWRARPNPAASAELVVPLRKANGPIFQDFCQGTEQRSLGSLPIAYVDVETQLFLHQNIFVRT